MALYIGGVAVDATAAEIDVLDGLDRGSIIYGNASSATTVLDNGTANQVLTSDGDDISWQSSSAAAITSIAGTAANQILTDDGDATVTSESNLTFDGTTLTVTGDVKTEGSGQSEFYRTSSAIDTPSDVLNIRHVTDGDMLDDFGTGVAFTATDSGATKVLGRMRFIRDGADNEGRLILLGRTDGGETILDIPASGRFAMGSGLQFKEVEKDSVSMADGAWRTVAQRTGEEDGLWLVMVGCPGSDNVFGTYWFRSYFAGSGQTIDIMFQSAVGAQWSGDNLQIKQGSGGTFTTEWCVYQFDSIG